MTKLFSLKLFLLVLLMVKPSPTFSQNIRYDIKNYDLIIRPDFHSGTIIVKAFVKIDNPGLQRSFTFGLNPNYSKVKVSADTTPVTFTREDARITVSAEHPSRKLTLSFYLEGLAGKSMGEKRNVMEDNSLFLLWSDRFYPIDFEDWATVQTTIILPKRYLAIAPGKQIASSTEHNKVTYIFKSSVPDANYSVMADSRWIKTEKKVNGITMQTLLYPKCQRFSEQIFKTSSRVLQFYSKTLYPYPFEQFSFVTIDGMYARRAFSGFIGYTPTYLEKEFTTTGYDAHETSLLWWGHILTGRGNGGWQWIEGFGDYSEIYFDQSYHKAIPKIFTYFRKKYLNSDLSKDYLYRELRGNTEQQFIHGKYPWLMQLLRYRLGDKQFNNAIRHLFERYKFRTVSMTEFLTALEKDSGESLTWFKDQWLERRGVPIISFNYKILETGEGNYKILGAIEQKNHLYQLPLEIGIKTKDQLRIEKINLNKKRLQFSFDSKMRPQKILLDPNNWIIMKRVKSL